MIHLNQVGVQFDDREKPVLRDVTCQIEDGEFLLVVGPTGSGKSTLLRTLNGLVPHFTGGTLTGTVQIDGRDTRNHRPRDLADIVGYVAQNPLSTFVTDTVESEIAYGMETLGVESAAMRRRVEETLDLFGLTELRTRSLRTLSGGQQQRVAIAAVFAAGPRTLVLDEPTSALDPVAAEDVLASLHRIVHDLGLTVVVAEHRLERVIHHADSIVLVGPDGVSGPHDPATAMARSVIHPPVVELGRQQGWQPLPLSVRQARRSAIPLRKNLSGVCVGGSFRSCTDFAVRADGLTVQRLGRVVLSEISVGFHRGSVAALMGRNGSGKSTLLATLAGQLSPTHGTATVGDVSLRELPAYQRVHTLGMVPQDATSLLYADSVGAECAAADKDFGAVPGTAAGLFAELIGEDIDSATHPRDLSEGQRLALALSVVLTGRSPVLLLDEPTRGLDYEAKERLCALLSRCADEGRCVVIATHDVELAAEVCDHVVVIADGEVVADGSAREVLSASPAFAPQIAKVMHPCQLLTVADVVAAQALCGEEQ